MKPGDAKLLMAVGALRGGWFFVYAGMYGAILGGLLAIVLIVGRRLIPPETAQPNPFWHLMRSSIPYGVALGLGALLALGRELAT
jgi:Flp pilus assembly protein protease CpaA